MGVTRLDKERIKASFRSDLINYVNDCFKFGLSYKELREVASVMREVADFTDSLQEKK